MQNLNLENNKASFLTDKYNFVSSEELTSKFLDSGFTLNRAGKSQLRIPVNPTLKRDFFSMSEVDQKLELLNYQAKMNRYNARLGHEKHWLSFKHGELALRQKENDLSLRVLNSYDGTSSLRVSLDIMRLVCSNGLVAPRALFEMSISHKSKNIKDDAIEAAYRIIERKDLLDEQIEKMKQVKLNQDQKIILLDTMLDFRLGKHDDKIIKAEMNQHLLKARRIEERDENLWQNFNTIQENMVKGSRINIIEVENNRINNIKIRSIKNDSADMFNERSWNYALSLAA